jgi:hypothetical protein
MVQAHRHPRPREKDAVSIQCHGTSRKSWALRVLAQPVVFLQHGAETTAMLDMDGNWQDVTDSESPPKKELKGAVHF